MKLDAAFWSCMGFVVFFIIIGRPAWKILVNSLDSRSEKIQHDIKEAARMRQEAQELLDACQLRHHETIEQSRQIIEHAHKEGQNLKAQALREMEEYTKREERMLLERIKAAEEKAVGEIRNRITDIATAMTRDMMAKTMSDETDREFCLQIGSELSRGPFSESLHLSMHRKV